MKKYILSILFFCVVNTLFSQASPNYESYLQSLGLETYYICVDNFDADPLDELIIFESIKINRFDYDLKVTFHDYSNGEYRKIRDYGLLHNTHFMSYQKLISLYFNNRDFPFSFIENTQIITKDIDNDSIKEIILFYHSGPSANYRMQILKLTKTEMIDMGVINGFQALSDNDNDGVYDIIAKTVTDGALLSTTDKTFFSYKLLGGQYQKVGLISFDDYLLIRDQLIGAFNVTKDIFSFNDAFLFQLVHGQNIKECQVWFNENVEKITDTHDNRRYIKAMEETFILPIIELQNGVDNPNSWKIYRYRPIDASYLESLSKDELRLLRNYFFAVNGYTFKSEDLQRYFTLHNIYKPVQSFDESYMEYMELENINKILGFENSLTQ